jgi:hypothetical protein
VAKLTGAAQRPANWHELSETAAGVAKLQEIIGGRPDGASLLAKVAGIFIGAREGNLDESGAMGAAELCIAAGAGKTRSRSGSRKGADEGRSPASRRPPALSYRRPANGKARPHDIG